MSDPAVALAKFLVEESREIPSQHLRYVLGGRFPGIKKADFFRGYAMAEELAVHDALEPLVDMRQ